MRKGDGIFVRGGIDYRRMIFEINKWKRNLQWFLLRSMNYASRRKRWNKYTFEIFRRVFEYDFTWEGLLEDFLINLPSFFKKNELDVRLSLIFKRFHLYGFRLWISNKKPWSSSNILYTISFPFEIFPLYIYIYIHPIGDIKYILECEFITYKRNFEQASLNQT